MTWLQRWRRVRLEWAKDALDEAESRLTRARRFQRAFGGHRGQIRAAERKRDRAEARIERLEPATEEPNHAD
jgi:hypothetical protein